MNDEDREPRPVTELKGMFGRAVGTVSINEMNRAIAARGADAGNTEAAPEDAAVSVEDPARYVVTAVEVVAPLVLRVAFADGTCGTVRFLSTHLTGVFAALNDPEVFGTVHIDGGAVAWPGGADLAPDAMYRAVKRSGEWVLA